MVTGVSTIPLATDDFIVGSENRLLEAAVYMLRSRAVGAQLLVLCGPAGSGKTHLARGLADAWDRSSGKHVENRVGASSHPAVVSLDAEKLRRGLADNRSPARLAAWRRRLRQAELLVVEDVHQLTGQESPQRELAATIDAVLADGGRVVLTSREMPGAMRTLEARLRSRLEAGLVINIASPQRPARLALLSAFAQQRGLTLDDRAGGALADAQINSAGELLAALDQLALRREGLIDRAAVRELTESTTTGRRPRVATIVAKVAGRYRLTPADLQGRSRRKSVAAARSLAMYLCRQLTDSHLHQIGEYLGGRDHTTVLHSCQKIEQLLTHDATTRAEVAQLRSELTGQNGKGRRRTNTKRTQD